MRANTDKLDKKELEAYYKGVLKDFARHYVAIWNALDSLGLSDPQIKGAISHIFERSGGSLQDTMKEARQEKNRKAYDDLVKEMRDDEPRPFMC